MVGRHDDEGVFRVRHLQRGGHRFIKGDRVTQRAGGIDAVMGVVDAATLHQQDIAIFLPGQARDGGLCQRRQ